MKSFDSVRGLWTGYVALRDAQTENEALKRELQTLQVRLQEERAAGPAHREPASAARAAPARRAANGGRRSHCRSGDARIPRHDDRQGQFRWTASRDMAVISPAGVVGRVILPSPRASRVQMLIDRNAAAGAMIERTRAQGIVVGQGDALRMDYVPGTADVKQGDLVVTSGIDKIYPKGFVIGTVDVDQPRPGHVHEITRAPSGRFLAPRGSAGRDHAAARDHGRADCAEAEARGSSTAGASTTRRRPERDSPTPPPRNATPRAATPRRMPRRRPRRPPATTSATAAAGPNARPGPAASEDRRGPGRHRRRAGSPDDAGEPRHSGHGGPRSRADRRRLLSADLRPGDRAAAGERGRAGSGCRCRAESSASAGWPRRSWALWPAFWARSSSSPRRCRASWSSSWRRVLHAAIFMGLYIAARPAPVRRPVYGGPEPGGRQRLSRGRRSAGGRAAPGLARAPARQARRRDIEVNC